MDIRADPPMKKRGQNLTMRRPTQYTKDLNLRDGGASLAQVLQLQVELQILQEQNRILRQKIAQAKDLYRQIEEERSLTEKKLKNE